MIRTKKNNNLSDGNMKLSLNFWQAFFFTVVITAMGVAYFALISNLYPIFIKNNWPGWIPSILDGLGRLVYALPIVLLLAWKSESNLRHQLFVPRAAELMFTVTVVIFLYVVFLSYRYFFIGEIPQLREFSYLKERWLYVIGTIVMAPIIEEVLFRGLFLNQFLIKYKTFIAILLSSFLFAITHLTPITAIYAFLFSIVLSLLYYKFKQSLIIAIVFHMIWNILSQVIY